MNNSVESRVSITNSGQNPRMGFELRKKGKFKGAEKFAKRMKEVQEKAKAALGKAQESMR